jgi:hypothetical protein
MRSFVAAALVASLFHTAAAPSHAQPHGAGETVRGYFEALGKNDFQRALSLTVGAAQERTARMVGSLKSQARAADARVELKVRRLRVAERPERLEAGLPVPVDVDFDIDVVGRKWWFSKIARRLAGTAQFYVASSVEPRIVAIEGKLE